MFFSAEAFIEAVFGAHTGGLVNVFLAFEDVADTGATK